VSRLSALGWKAKMPLREGLAQAYADFLTNEVRER
jgi:nucleoside-diphosphate-sugar epimerase